MTMEFESVIFAWGKPVSSQTQHQKPSPLRLDLKVPRGITPYDRAKQLQLVDKDLEGALLMFRVAIKVGDRVDSAVKDMACILQQLGRVEEAIDTIGSMRNLCSPCCQEALDNILLELYKKCRKYDEQIELLKRKIEQIEAEAFNGKSTRKARSNGRRFHASIQQQISRLLSNLGWAYMQQGNYVDATMAYSKALSIDPNGGRACNLALCLIKGGKIEEAVGVLETMGYLIYEDPKSYRIDQEIFLGPRGMGIANYTNDHYIKKRKRLQVFEQLTGTLDSIGPSPTQCSAQA